jgi:transposase
MQLGGSNTESSRDSGYHNNALSHTALVVQQFLAERNIPVTTQPPYSPDLAPNDFWLFLTMKT